MVVVYGINYILERFNPIPHPRSCIFFFPPAPLPSLTPSRNPSLRLPTLPPQPPIPPPLPPRLPRQTALRNRNVLPDILDQALAVDVVVFRADVAEDAEGEGGAVEVGGEGVQDVDFLGEGLVAVTLGMGWGGARTADLTVFP